MIVALAAAIILNGSTYISSVPPLLEDGSVAVAVTPALTRIVQRITVDPDTERIVFANSQHHAEMQVGMRQATVDGRTITVAFAPFSRAGEVYVPFADVVRAFGGTIASEPRAKRIVVTTNEPTPLATMKPFDARAPQVTPRVIFTPEPKVTPRPEISGSPAPRRTPIPVVPSRPDPATQGQITRLL